MVVSSITKYHHFIPNSYCMSNHDFLKQNLVNNQDNSYEITMNGYQVRKSAK